MARRTKVVTISTADRDKGKQFYLTEMDADSGERFCGRALLALSRGGFDLPDGVFENGWAGLVSMMPLLLVVGLRALHGAQWAEIEPLLDEMMNCVKFQPPGMAGNTDLLQPLFPGSHSQIEEISTRWMLRKEVVQLHAGFSLADALPTSGAPAAEPQPA